MRVITAQANTPYRLLRVFKTKTTIYIQIKHPTAKFFFDFDQGAVQSGGSGTGSDALCLMAVNTNPAVTPLANPFALQILGELWYASDTVNADFVFTETGQ
jgi:hypothetical protein